MLNKMSLYRVKKGFVYLRYFGIKEFLVRLKERILLQKIDYEKWYQNHKRSEEELNEQCKEKFAYEPLISIVVPVYRVPKEFLLQMLASIRGQTYGNWEICMTCTAEESRKVKEAVKKIELTEKQIKLVILSGNNGIAENTNAAIAKARGEYIGFLDQDDLLSKDALYEVVKKLNEDQKIDLVYSDEDKVSADLQKHFQPHLKPDFNLDLLRSNNYICHFCTIRKCLIEEVGGLRKGYDGAQDYDLILRCIEKGKVAHIPRILYHWRMHESSTADNPISKSYAFDAGKRAIEAHLERCGIEAEVLQEIDRGFYRIKYKVQGNPKVSILIPNKDHIKDLERCLQSVEKSTYKNYEIIIVENNSEKQETFTYYENIKSDRVRILRWNGEFNYSAINNYAVSKTKSEYLVLLNNDTKVIEESWLEEMLANCQRPEVGIVGAKLYYPNGQIQHAGVVVGIRGIAGNMFRGLQKEYSGYMHKASTQQNLSAVTAACMMVKKAIYEEVGGFEEQLAVAFNDVDFCLKVRQRGYLVVYDPYVKLYHYESRSRGAEDNEEKIRRYQSEIDYVRGKWQEIMEKGDPMYNPNLTLVKCDYSLREKDGR